MSIFPQEKVLSLFGGNNKNQFLFSLPLTILCMGNQYVKIKCQLFTNRVTFTFYGRLQLLWAPISPSLWLMETLVSLLAHRSVSHPESLEVTYHIVMSPWLPLTKGIFEASVRKATMKMPVFVFKSTDLPTVLILGFQSSAGVGERKTSVTEDTVSRLRLETLARPASPRLS